jgi:hypothetical protein
MPGAARRVGVLPASWRKAPDPRWFLVHNILFIVLIVLGIGIGVSVVRFNRYLVRLGPRQDLIGACQGLTTLARAVGTVAAVSPLAAPAPTARYGELGVPRVPRLVSVPITLPLVCFPSAVLGIGARAARTISTGMAWAVVSAVVTGIVPRAARAPALSDRSAARNLGYALAGLVAGALIVRYGRGLAFLSYRVFSAASATVSQVYVRRRARRDAAASRALAAEPSPHTRG